MNEESSTISIIVVLLVLGFVVIGAISLIRLIARAFLRQPSQQDTGYREKKQYKEADDILEKNPTPSQKKSPHGYPAPKTKNKNRMRHRVKSGWIPKDERVHVSGREISGMVYVGQGSRTGQFNQPDNAFINPRMKVAAHGGDYEGQGMDYWPSYSTIDSRSRATYLDWLSGNRADTRYNVGYVFLYFYGLERRVFFDKTDPQERADIIAEVRRLLDIYGKNPSIRRYLGTFIDTTNLLDPNNDPQPVFERGGYNIPANVLFALGNMAARKIPLTSDWLLSWFLCHPEIYLRTPAKRAFAEFKTYFQYLFNQKYPEGLRIRIPKRTLKLKYHASSGNFTTDLSEYIGDVPDISRLSTPLRIAQEIANESTDGLDKYSRYLGRNPEGKNTIGAHTLLPKALWSLFPCPEKEELQVWAAKQIESSGFVPVEDVVERLEGARPDRIRKRQLIEVADTLASLGVGMAPDPRFALRNPRLGEPVILFDLPKDTLTIESPSEPYRSAILRLAIAMLVAHSDGQVNHAEREHLSNQINANQSVSDAEQARLRANLSWMITVPPDIGMLRTRLRNASEESRSVLGQLAVFVAGADGAIDPEEIRIIERLYSTMGLNRERVYADLHALTSTSEPVTVRPAGRAVREFAIPSSPDMPAGVVILDATRVSAVMADTARVSQVLGDIFAEEDDEEESSEDDISETDNEFSGLDALHSTILSVLITRRQWTEGEIEKLAEEHKLMASGALTTINEWAFDKFDDPLIEEYEGYEINGDIVQQLMH